MKMMRRLAAGAAVQCWKLCCLVPVLDPHRNRGPAVEAYTTHESRTYNYTAVGERVEVFSTVAYPQYSCYKIPYLFQTLNGTIIAFAEARGPTDDEGSIGNCMDWDITDVVMRKSYDGGASWSPMQVLLRGKHDWHFVVGNLAPVQSEFSGRLFLPFTRGNSRMWMTYSDDNGESYAPPYRLSFEGFWWTWVGFGPPAGMQISYNAKYRGRLLIPGYFSDSPVFDLTALFGSSAFVLLSDDGGLSWRVVVISNAHQELLGIAGNEDQVVEHCDGTLLLNSRTWIGDRAQSWSHDGGNTWSPLERVALPNPFQGCQGSVMNLNRHVLLYSGLKGAGKSDWDAVRRDLTLWWSDDVGKSWHEHMVIHEGGVSYSALYRLLDGRVAVIYEIGNLSPIFIPLNIYVKILPRFDLSTGVDDANTGTTATALPGVVPRDDSMSCDRNATTLFALEPRRFFYADGSDSRVEVSTTPPSPSEVEWPAQWSLPLRAYPMTWQETAQKSRFSSHSTFMWSFHWWVTIFATVGLLILSGMVAFLASTCCLLPVCRSRRKVLVQENLVSGPQLGWMLVEQSGCAKALCRGRELLMERNKTHGECACCAAADDAGQHDASAPAADSCHLPAQVEVEIEMKTTTTTGAAPAHQSQDGEQPRHQLPTLLTSALSSSTAEHGTSAVDAHAVRRTKHGSACEAVPIEHIQMDLAFHDDVATNSLHSGELSLSPDAEHHGEEEVQQETKAVEAVAAIGEVDSLQGCKRQKIFTEQQEPEPPHDNSREGNTSTTATPPAQPEDEAVSFSNSGGIFISLNAERDEGKAEHVEQRGVKALPARVAAFFRQRENQTRYCLPLLQLANTVWLLFWMLGGLLALFFAHDDPVRWVFQTNLSLFGMALSVLLGLGKMHFFAELPSFRKQLAERPSVEVAVFMLTVILVTSICSTTL